MKDIFFSALLRLGSSLRYRHCSIFLFFRYRSREMNAYKLSRQELHAEEDKILSYYRARQ